MRAIFWGLPPPLSVMLTAAVRKPVNVGMKRTIMLHVPPGATRPWHVLLTEKSPLSVPITLILEMVSVVEPRFVSTAIWGWLILPTITLPKFSLVLDSLTASPVPVNEIVCGLFPPLSEMETVAVLVPPVTGMNFTVIVQFAPTSKFDGQLFLSGKSCRYVSSNRDTGNVYSGVPNIR